MTRALPPLTWFRSFEAAARHLSFTAAADELGLTQSAISQQVRSLEMRLGVELFLRRHRGLSLTDDGRKLLPRVGSALDSLAQASASFETGSTRDLLTIATSISIAQWIIAPHLRTFLDSHPGLRVRILGTIWPDDFNASIADVAIRFGSARQVGENAERLLPDRLVVVAKRELDGPLDDQVLIEAVGTSESWRGLGERRRLRRPSETARLRRLPWRRAGSGAPGERCRADKFAACPGGSRQRDPCPGSSRDPGQQRRLFPRGAIKDRFRSCLR